MAKGSSADGFSIGLALWLFFLICFAALRYPVVWSILVGGIGAFAGGFVVTWWQSKAEVPPSAQPTLLDTKEFGKDDYPTSRGDRPNRWARRTYPRNHQYQVDRRDRSRLKNWRQWLFNRKR